MKPYQLIKNRSDIGAGTRGSDLGIDALEIAAINKGNSFFDQYPVIDVETRNRVIYNEEFHPYAKRINSIIAQCNCVAAAVSNAINDGYLPLVLSGDHSSAIGTVGGIKRAYPNKVLGVIWIDAHADLHSPFTTPSGNIHGMSVAATMDEDNVECIVNKVSAETVEQWNSLKKISTSQSKLQPRHLVYFGVREVEVQEQYLIEKLRIQNYPVEHIRTEGVTRCVENALMRLSDCDLIYISFDVDSMDSELISMGTGTPVIRGFAASEIDEIIRLFSQSKKIICIEVVEINPLLDDKGNKMAEVAFDILDKIAM